MTTPTKQPTFFMRHQHPSAPAEPLPEERRGIAAKIRQRCAVLLRNDAAYLMTQAAASGDAELMALATEFADVRAALERRAAQVAMGED